MFFDLQSVHFYSKMIVTLNNVQGGWSGTVSKCAFFISIVVANSLLNRGHASGPS